MFVGVNMSDDVPTALGRNKKIARYNSHATGEIILSFSSYRV